MGIVQAIVSALQETITGSASAIGSGIEGLLFETVEGTQTLSTAGQVIFTLFGLGMGVGLMYVIFNLVVRR